MLGGGQAGQGRLNDLVNAEKDRWLLRTVVNWAITQRAYELSGIKRIKEKNWNTLSVLTRAEIISELLRSKDPGVRTAAERAVGSLADRNPSGLADNAARGIAEHAKLIDAVSAIIMRMGPRRYDVTDWDKLNGCEKYDFIKSVLEHFGLVPAGGNYRHNAHAKAIFDAAGLTYGQLLHKYYASAAPAPEDFKKLTEAVKEIDGKASAAYNKWYNSVSAVDIESEGEKAVDSTKRRKEQEIERDEGLTGYDLDALYAAVRLPEGAHRRDLLRWWGTGLKSSSESARQKAGRELRALGNEYLIGKYAVAASSKNKAARAEAVMEIGGLRALPGIRPRVAEMAIRCAIRALSDKEASVRKAAVKALKELNIPEERLMRGYTHALSSKDRYARREAVKAISALCAKPGVTIGARRAAFDGLAPIFTDKIMAKIISPLRSPAQEAAGKILATYLPGLIDNDAGRRLEAVEAIGALILEPNPTNAAGRPIPRRDMEPGTKKTGADALIPLLADQDAQVVNRTSAILTDMGIMPPAQGQQQPQRGQPITTKGLRIASAVALGIAAASAVAAAFADSNALPAVFGIVCGVSTSYALMHAITSSFIKKAFKDSGINERAGPIAKYENGQVLYLHSDGTYGAITGSLIDTTNLPFPNYLLKPVIKRWIKMHELTHKAGFSDTVAFAVPFIGLFNRDRAAFGTAMESGSVRQLFDFFYENTELGGMARLDDKWKKRDGTLMTRDTHIKEAVTALERLMARDAAYVNDGLRGENIDMAQMDRLFDLVGEVVSDERSRELLFVALALHDVGSLYSIEDHEVRGEAAASGILEKLGYDPEKTKMVKELVGYHGLIWRILKGKASVSALGGHSKEIIKILAVMTLADVLSSGDRYLTSGERNWANARADDILTVLKAALFDDSMKKRVAAIKAEVGQADIVVAIPCYNEKDNIGQLIAVVKRGLAVYYPDKKAVIVVMGESSRPGETPASTLETAKTQDAGAIRVIAFPKEADFKGKKWSFRGSMLIAQALAANMVSLDADLRMDEEWIRSFLGPVMSDEADFVAPNYLRRYATDDQSIADHLTYPLMSALYGKRVRENGGEFAVNKNIFSEYLADLGLWGSDFVIETRFVTTAAMRGKRIVDAKLGEKHHNPGSDIEKRFPAYVSVIFDYVMADADYWQQRLQNADIEAVGITGPPSLTAKADLEIPAAEIVDIDAEAWIAQYKGEDGFSKYAGYYRANFPSVYPVLERLYNSDNETFALSGAEWMRAVFAFFGAYIRAKNTAARQGIANALRPIYQARIVTFKKEAEGLTVKKVEGLLDAQAAAFAKNKGALVRPILENGYEALSNATSKLRYFDQADIDKVKKDIGKEFSDVLIMKADMSESGRAAVQNLVPSVEELRRLLSGEELRLNSVDSYHASVADTKGNLSYAEKASLREMLKAANAFSITLKGIAVTPDGAIIVKGYVDTVDLYGIRQAVQNAGLGLRNARPKQFVHMTIGRVQRPLGREKLEQLLRWAEKYSQTEFGVWNVTHVQRTMCRDGYIPIEEVVESIPLGPVSAVRLLIGVRPSDVEKVKARVVSASLGGIVEDVVPAENAEALGLASKGQGLIGVFIDRNIPIDSISDGRLRNDLAEIGLTKGYNGILRMTNISPDLREEIAAAIKAILPKIQSMNAAEIFAAVHEALISGHVSIEQLQALADKVSRRRSEILPVYNSMPMAESHKATDKNVAVASTVEVAMSDPAFAQNVRDGLVVGSTSCIIYNERFEVAKIQNFMKACGLTEGEMSTVKLVDSRGLTNDALVQKIAGETGVRTDNVFVRVAPGEIKGIPTIGKFMEIQKAVVNDRKVLLTMNTYQVALRILRQWDGTLSGLKDIIPGAKYDDKRNIFIYLPPTLPIDYGKEIETYRSAMLLVSSAA